MTKADVDLDPGVFFHEGLEALATLPVFWRYGPWVYVRQRMTLAFRPKGDRPRIDYEVPLGECGDPAGFADWVAQLAEKSWVTERDLGWFARAVDELIGIPRGEEREDVREHLRENVHPRLVRRPFDPEAFNRTVRKSRAAKAKKLGRRNVL